MVPAAFEIECPPEVEYIWRLFRSLDQRRTSSGFGANPITHADLAAWEQRLSFRLTPFEWECIDALEAAVMGHHRTKAKEHAEKAKLKDG